MDLKNRLAITLALLCALILFTAFMPAQNKESKWPFAINYRGPLKMMNEEHLSKYDYNEYTRGDDVIQLKCYKHISKAEAQKLIEDRKFFLMAMFKDQPSPYPGALSATIGCPEADRPRPIEDTVAVRMAYKLLATKNLVYGNCNISDNYYYCAYVIFFCREKDELFELKLFTPIKQPSFNYDSLVSSVGCIN